MAATDPCEVARPYQDTRARIVALMTGPENAAWNTAVAACPGWSVRDVVAHMTGVAEDWVSGRLAGPPTDEQTAAQIARFSGHDVAGILTAWKDAGARLDHLAATNGVEPPLGDVVCHEHDVRGAIDRPGARDSAGVWHASDRLLTILDTPVSIRVTVEDGDYRSGPDDEPEIQLRTERFEALRCGQDAAVAPSSLRWTGRATRSRYSTSCTCSAPPTLIWSSSSQGAKHLEGQP